MSATDLEHSDAHQYFQSIEETFVRLRGAPLLLSSSDWQTAQRWQRAGIPLDVVLGAIEEVFRGREDAPARKRPLDLRYCAKAVENAWATIRELTAASAPAPSKQELEVAPRLAALAEALPRRLSDVESWRSRILELKGTPRQVEKELEGLDGELMSEAADGLRPAARKKVDEQVRLALAAVAGRLSATEAEHARERLSRRVLRQHLALPVLSLFAPEIEAVLRSQSLDDDESS